jgi:hypothetical protein
MNTRSLCLVEICFCRLHWGGDRIFDGCRGRSSVFSSLGKNLAFSCL